MRPSVWFHKTSLGLFQKEPLVQPGTQVPREPSMWIQMAMPGLIWMWLSLRPHAWPWFLAPMMVLACTPVPMDPTSPFLHPRAWPWSWAPMSLWAWALASSSVTLPPWLWAASRIIVRTMSSTPCPWTRICRTGVRWLVPRWTSVLWDSQPATPLTRTPQISKVLLRVSTARTTAPAWALSYKNSIQTCRAEREEERGEEENGI